MIAEAGKRGNELRFWSAGCATGEEAYSLAILVDEVLGADLERFSVRIFATDLDEQALAYARRGLYPPGAVAGVPQDALDCAFTRDGALFEVVKRVRELVIFGEHDLAQRAPFPRIDLVLCRNVLIYFTPKLKRRALQLFAYALREGGYLALGKAETVAALEAPFVPHRPDLHVYRRHGERVLLLPVPAGPALAASPADAATHRLRGLRARVRSQAVPEHAPWSTLAVRDLPFGVVVIDRRYDIRAINGAARRLLSIQGPAIGQDLLHAGALPYTDLRAAIDRALREGGTVTLADVTLDRAPLGPRLVLQVSCSRLSGPGGEGEQDDVVLLLVHDVTPAADVRLSREREREALRADVARLEEEGRRQAEDLRRAVDANRELLEANQQLTSLNEELRATNEDLLAHTEEAQAAAEEVETLNEELQATNEELETLNEELQATVEELNTANDELRARSLEGREPERAGETGAAGG